MDLRPPTVAEAIVVPLTFLFLVYPAPTLPCKRPTEIVKEVLPKLIQKVNPSKGKIITYKSVGPHSTKKLLRAKEATDKMKRQSTE